MAPKGKTAAKAETGANLGFEAKLWAAADALRNNMDAAEYKHVVLGLIFLKYISDAFEAKHAELDAQRRQGADPEDPDEYRAATIFWVPKEARWSHLKANAPQPTIGTLVDDAMSAIERDNASLKGVLPKDFARPGLDKVRLGQLINLVSDIALGSSSDRAKDTLGRVYEYFLSRFASAEGKSGGQFYTPSSVVRVLVEMLAPYKGRVYDPCCGSGGMFVSSEKFIEAHSGKLGDISIYGQESNYTTWRLAKMNLAIRGIDAQIAHGDTFHADRTSRPEGRLCARQPALQRQRLARGAADDDVRWVYGVAARGQRQLRLGAALHPPPGADRACRLRARQRLDVIEPVGRGRDPQGHHRGRPRRLHGRAAGPALLFDADPGLPVVCRPQQKEREV
jgi:type I restriction enzyme M protein